MLQRFAKHLPSSFSTQAGNQDVFGNIENYIHYLVDNHKVVAPHKGIIHVGAHRCEELAFYTKLNINNILWIDGNEQLCKENPNIVHALVADVDGKEVDFIITNNDGMSSSICELKEHLVEHPDCVEETRIKQTTITLDTLMEKNKYDKNDYDMLVLDVQGAELMVLKGSLEALAKITCIVTEVNTKELYAGCPLIEDLDAFLLQQGFLRVYTSLTSHGWGDAIYVRRTITMYIGSGLGNRLFQLATLYALAKTTNSIAVLYDDLIDVCDIHCSDKAKYDIFYQYFKRVGGAPPATFLDVIREEPSKPCIYVDYMPVINKKTQPILVFKGFFQSEQFFGDFKDEIRQMFLTALDHPDRPVNRQIENFIHVRGRDHIHQRNITHHLSNIAAYYSDALQRYPQLTPNNTIIITDDEKYVASLSVLNKFKCTRLKDELDDLYFMCQCKNINIIPNSTFSWWGAFLAAPTTLVMPIPFLLLNKEYEDIYPNGAIRVNATDGDNIFENIVSARRNHNHVTIILVRKGPKDKWISSFDDVFINGIKPKSVVLITKDRHNDAYNDLVVIEDDVDTDEVKLTINNRMKTITFQSCEVTTKYDLVAMTLFKDDVALIEGWVKYHTDLGVEHFFLYYNGDKPVETLPCLEHVTYIEWSYPYLFDQLHFAQFSAMTDMIYQARNFTKYVMFSDLDEYISWRPKNVSFTDFIMNNNFAVYGFLNNFVTVDEPSKDIGTQIVTNKFARTYEMPYGTRSKNIVNVHKLDGMGIHKPLDNALDDDMCVLASRTCELLHVCNVHGRRNSSLSFEAIEQFIRVAEKTRGLNNSQK